MMRACKRSSLVVTLLGLAFAASLVGCSRPDAASVQAAPSLVLYTSADQAIVEPVLDAYRRETGEEVSVVYLPQTPEGSALVGRLYAERSKPKAGVYWAADIPEAQGIVASGLAESEPSLTMDGVPEGYVDPEGRWRGFGARARVILYDPKAVGNTPPKRFSDLADPVWQGKAAMARPTSGSALIHAAALAQASNPSEAAFLFRRIKANGVELVGSEMSAAVMVTSGRSAWAVVDSDVAMEVSRDRPVKVAVPDLEEKATVLIPQAAGLVKGAPDPKAARKLLNYLVTRQGEAVLGLTKAALIPISVGAPPPPAGPDVFLHNTLKVDYRKLPESLAEMQRLLTPIFAE